jgi:tetratricopeptide (TPR) repeat protein
MGDFIAAEPHYRRALKIAPNYSEARHNLGCALVELHRLEEATECFRQVISEHPELAQAHANLALVLKKQFKFPEAEASARRYIEIAGDDVPGNMGLAVVFAEQGRFDEALKHWQRVLELDPLHSEAVRNQSVMLLRQNKLNEAMSFCERALAIDQANPEAHLTKGIILLKRGQFLEGWPEYEWRFRCQYQAKSFLPQPRWNGEPLEGRTIVVRSEQGLGDTIQFVRYAEQLRNRGAKVIVQCQPQLMSLLSSYKHADYVVKQNGPAPPFDYHIPLLSVLGKIGATVENIPATIPYLAPTPNAVEKWRDELADGTVPLNPATASAPSRWLTSPD